MALEFDAESDNIVDEFEIISDSEAESSNESILISDSNQMGSVEAMIGRILSDMMNDKMTILR